MGSAADLSCWHVKKKITYTQVLHISDLLAKTSAEVDEIHKQQRDSSRNVSEIFTIIERLNTSVQYSIECQRHQLADIKKSLQGK